MYSYSHDIMVVRLILVVDGFIDEMGNLMHIGIKDM